MEPNKKVVHENITNEIDAMINLNFGPIHNLATALAMAAIAIVESETQS